MPSINLEMMKQLLQEFSEKEALTNEEINVIETEIVSLEERVNFCRKKLQNLVTDKEKLSAMQERYIIGKFPLPTRTIPSQIHDNLSADTTETKKNVPNQLDSTKDETIKSEQDADNLANTNPNQESKLDTNEIVANVNDNQLTEPADDNQSDNIKKDGSEPIKSINEALKGLFRK